MKKLIPLFLVVGTLITINSCRRDMYQVICYGDDIQPILTKSCTNIGCHSAGSKSAGYAFTAYDGVLEAVVPGDAKSSPLYKAIKGSHPQMPKEGEKLTRKQVNMIKSWIDFGAKDCASTNTMVSNCDTLNVAYTTHIKPIIDGFCIGCHSIQAPTLNTYTEVKNAVNAGSFLPAVKHTGAKPMPQGGQKLSNCNLAKIDKWVQAGMPN